MDATLLSFGRAFHINRQIDWLTFLLRTMWSATICFMKHEFKFQMGKNDDFTFNYSQRLPFRRSPLSVSDWNDCIMVIDHDDSTLSSLALALFLLSILRFPSFLLHINVHRNSVCHCYYKKCFPLLFVHAHIASHSRVSPWVWVSVDILGILLLWKCDNSMLNVVLFFSSIDQFRANDDDDQSHCAHRKNKPCFWKKTSVMGKERKKERSGWLVEEMQVSALKGNSCVKWTIRRVVFYLVLFTTVFFNVRK